MECRGAVVAKRKKRISKKEFEERLTAVIADHLSTMPVEEQKARLHSAERRLSKISRAERPTASRTPETSPIRKPSRAARQAAEKIASILEEHLNTLPAAEKAAKLKAFHGSVSASFAGRATSAKRSKTAAPVFSRVAAQR